MSFTADEFGRSVAAPGLVFPDIPYTCFSGVMADSSDLEGGFPVYKKKGEDVKVYATKPAEDGYFFGVAQRIVTRDEYPAGTPVSIITKGLVWVIAGGDVKSGDSVYVTADGKFTAASSGNTAEAGAKFITSAASGSFVVLELN